jgi:hypothetical protein
VAAVLLLLAVAIFLRSKAPPEAARLLPESDGIVYINLKTVRSFSHLKEVKPPERVAEYQQFIDAIGTDPERDLDEAAIALHRMENPNGANGPVAYSMVLVGKITGNRLNGWLDAHSTSRESYSGHTVYSIPSEGRTVRVAQIGYDMVAVSNYPTTEKIHSMLDRHATAAWPFAGSTLLRQHFHEVPLLSLAWGVGEIGLPFSESGAIRIFGLSLPLEADSTIIASLGWTGTVRIEEIAPTDAVAIRQSAALETLIILARDFTLPRADNAANKGLKTLLKTAEVTQKRDRVVITATLTPSLFNSPTGGENPAPDASGGPGAFK